MHDLAQVHAQQVAQLAEQKQQLLAKQQTQQLLTASAAERKRGVQVKGVPRLLAEAQDTVARMQQQERQALQEQERLKMRIRVLDITLPVLEQQVEALRDSQTQFKPKVTIRQVSDSAARLASTGEAHSPSSHSESTSQLETFDSSDANALLSEPVFMLPNGQTSLAHMPESAVVKKAALSALISSQQNNSRSMAHLHGFEQLLKETVQKLAVHCLAHDVHPNQPRHLQYVEHYLAAFRHRMRELVLVEPNFWYLATNRNLETGEVCTPPPGHWMETVSTMKPTPAQYADCSAALDLFEEQMEGLLAERGKLMARLSELLEPHSSEQYFNYLALENTVAIDETIEAVEKNLAKERSARHVLSTFLGLPCVFTLHQIARAYIGAWPFMVDVVEICRAVVETGKADARLSEGAGGSGAGSLEGQGGASADEGNCMQE